MSRTHETTLGTARTLRRSTPGAARPGGKGRRTSVTPPAGLAAASHAELVRLAAGGDEVAWEELVDRFDPLVRGVAGRNVGWGEAADVAQATWLRLFEHIGDLQDPERLPGWLKTTTTREARNYVTKASRQVPCADVPEEPASGSTDDVERRLDAQATKQVVQRALSRLTPQQSRLLTLLMSDEDPSYREISARTGMAVGSIGPTRDRSLAKLRRVPSLLAVAVA